MYIYLGYASTPLTRVKLDPIRKNVMLHPGYIKYGDGD